MVTALSAAYTIWLREMWRFARDYARLVGMIGQPLLYLVVIGKGISATMGLRGAPEGLDYITFMYPGILAMSVLFTSVFSGVSVIWDRDFGVLKEVLVAPVPRWAVAVGKAFGGATVTTIQTAILLVLAPVAGIPLALDGVVEMLALAFLLSLGLTFFGLALASRMTSMQGFQMIMNFLVMPLYFLSGAMFPLTSGVPAWMSALMHVDPLTYGVDALRHAIYSGPTLAMMKAAELVRFDVVTDIMVLVALSAALAAVATTSFNRTRSA